MQAQTNGRVQRRESETREIRVRWERLRESDARRESVELTSAQPVSPGGWVCEIQLPDGRMAWFRD